MKQRTAMSRGSGFKRPEYIRKPPSPLSKGRMARMTGGDGDVVAVPKEVKARPGKRAPTVEEKKWMDRIVAWGCVCCGIDGNARRPAAVHHILRGGVRMGHLYTLPLCDPGHHQNGDALGLISRHPWKARFEEKYGTELKLLADLRMYLLMRDATEKLI